MSVIAACTAGELRTWCAIAAYANKEGNAWPGQPTLAKMLGVSPKAIQLQVKALRGKGLVQTRRIPTGLLYHLPPLVAELPLNAQPVEARLPNPPVAELGAFGRPATTPPVAQLPLEQTKNRPENKPKNRPTKGRIEALFAVWQEVTKRPRSRLDDKRRKDLEKGLALLGFAEAQKALRGLGLSKWHQGENDRGKPYNEPFHVFRDAEHAERFLGDYEEAQHPERRDMRELLAKWDHHFHEGIAAVEAGADRGGVPAHTEPELRFPADALLACIEAGRRLVAEVGDQGVALARERCANADEEYQDELRRMEARNVEDEGPNTGGDSEGGGPPGGAADPKGEIGVACDL